MNILVCDDDKSIVDAICIYLHNEGYKYNKAYNGQEALKILNRLKFHLVITDVMMPLIDGIQLTHQIRHSFNMPIIILSAKGEQSGKILGLNMGADDYISKPFDPVELIARVKSQLRRYTKLGSMPSVSTYKTGGLELDDIKKTVYLDGENVKLTPVEYKILLLLLKSPGQVYSIDQIYEAVWQDPSFQS